MNMRSDTAQKLKTFSKHGDFKQCFKADPNNKEHIKEVEIYCASMFSQNMPEFMNCKEPESFCYACCEKEFGSLQAGMREICVSNRCEHNSLFSKMFSAMG